jgi:hypothetical protein
MSDTKDPARNKELANQTVDYAVLATKLVLGAIPIPGGSFLAELVGVVIPNQRTERIVKTLEALGKRLAQLEELVRSRITDENFTDLFEEGLRQAARSLSDERRVLGYRVSDRSPVAFGGLDRVKLPSWMASHLPTTNSST